MRPSHWIIAAAILGTTACGGGYVQTQPPPERVEVIERPGARYVFVPGRWRWSGNQYVWNSGRWVVPGHGRTDWVAGHWVSTPRGWRWVDGRWR